MIYSCISSVSGWKDWARGLIGWHAQLYRLRISYYRKCNSHLEALKNKLRTELWHFPSLHKAPRKIMAVLHHKHWRLSSSHLLTFFPFFLIYCSFLFHLCNLSFFLIISVFPSPSRPFYTFISLQHFPFCKAEECAKRSMWQWKCLLWCGHLYQNWRSY